MRSLAVLLTLTTFLFACAPQPDFTGMSEEEIAAYKALKAEIDAGRDERFLALINRVNTVDNRIVFSPLERLLVEEGCNEYTLANFTRAADIQAKCAIILKAGE